MAKVAVIVAVVVAAAVVIISVTHFGNVGSQTKVDNLYAGGRRPHYTKVPPLPTTLRGALAAATASAAVADPYRSSRERQSAAMRAENDAVRSAQERAAAAEKQRAAAAADAADRAYLVRCAFLRHRRRWKLKRSLKFCVYHWMSCQMRHNSRGFSRTCSGCQKTNRRRDIYTKSTTRAAHVACRACMILNTFFVLCDRFAFALFVGVDMRQT